jgi:hypothetical protein
MAQGRIITFYSYKGGTGRSMSVANTAWILASNGLRVLIVDWDLEAPGLHRFLHPFLPDADLRFSSGVIDLMWEFAAAAADPAEHEPGWHEELAVLAPYVMSVEYDFPRPGTIDLIPAGRQNHLYATLVTSFDWANFYEHLGGGGFLEALKRRMRAEYDYVLIDSRTGLSDTAGICTVQLPDILVDCFSLSGQAIDGAAAVAASVHRQRGPAQLRVFPVPMRVEDGEQDKLEASRDYARAQFGPFLSHVPDPERYWGEVEVPYRRYYAYEEILATIGDRPQQEGTILAVTERIVGYLTGDQVTGLGSAIPEPERRELLALFQRGRTAAPGEAGRALMAGAPRVFITFAYESAEQFETIRDLWFALRGHGIDARLDLAPGQRQPDWPGWQAGQLSDAQVVLVIAAAGKRWQSEEDAGAIRAAIHADPHRFLGVGLPGARDLPGLMASGAEAVLLSALDAEGTAELVRLIWQRVPEAVPADPGGRRPVPGHPDGDRPVPGWRLVPEVSPYLAQKSAGLSRAAAAQCTADLAARGLLDSYSGTVRWSSTSSLAAGAVAAEPASGTAAQIADAFLSAPRGRLVLLGDPGSGKTVLAQALILSLLRSRTETEPVPVLLPAASWDPDAENLAQFVVARLRRDYPMLGDSARDLVQDGLIVPVLDGLDELPSGDLISAIAALDRYSASAGAFVVTCRTQEYERVVGKTGQALSGAVVVTVQPVSMADARAYLSAGAVGDDRRWPRFFAELASHPDSPAARALSSPLYLWLAREVYRSPGTDPAALLKLPGETAVQRKLLGALIPASYDQPPPASRRARSYPANAQRWLSDLAVWMRAERTEDLAWWRVPRMLGRGRLAVLLCAASVLLLSIAADVSFAAVATTASPPFRVPNPPLLLGAPAAIAALLAAVIPWAAPRPAARAAARSRARSRVTLGGAVNSLIDSMAITAAYLAVTAILAGLATGIASFLLDSRSSWFAAGVVEVIVAMCVAAVPLAWRSAWTRYALAVTLLWLAGRLPRRLLPFLEDARRRGLLRRTGAVYQFRHAALRDLLAGDPDPGGPSEERR